MEQTTKPPKKLYWRWWMWVIYVISFLIVVAHLSEGPSNNVAITPPPPQAMKVTAEKIIEDYKDNGVAADATYKGKLVEITGTVKTIDKDVLQTPYISLESYEYAIVDHVQCMFPKSSETELASVTKGQKITLRGTVANKLGNLIVEDCSIVK